MARLSVLFLMCLLLGASVVIGQEGAIGAFGDPGLSSCSVGDPGPQVVTLCVGHLFTDGAKASKWKFDISATLSMWIWLSDEVP